jgi:hypothetical protein
VALSQEILTAGVKQCLEIGRKIEKNAMFRPLQAPFHSFSCSGGMHDRFAIGLFLQLVIKNKGKKHCEQDPDRKKPLFSRMKIQLFRK